MASIMTRMGPGARRAFGANGVSYNEPLMTRDLRRLADTRFDVLVIGAGIYGAATAWDAAQRGLSVGIVDRQDFGAGTSFNNLKTVHGGLRSLQALDLGLMRRFIRERRAIARIVPHLVRRMPFVVATTRHPKRSRLVMRMALAINDAIARDRNEGLTDPALHIPPGEMVTRDEVLHLNPVVAPDGVTGGAVWHDYQMTNADRVTLSFVLSAVEAGAVAANYTRVTDLVVEQGRVTGAAAEDRLTGGTFRVSARVVVNAAGAWARDVVEGLPGAAAAAPAPGLSRAMNLVVKPVVRTHACGGLAHGRYLFLVPWRDVSILGTSHDAHAGSADALAVTRWDLEALLQESRDAFPQANLRLSDVRLVHKGLLPMVAGRGADVTLLKESQVVDHAPHGAPGLVSIHGVRYTTARHTAEQAVDLVFRVLGHTAPPRCRTADTPLAGAVGHLEHALDEALALDLPNLPPPVLTHLVGTYGTAWNRVRQIAGDIPVLAERLGRSCHVLGAEILHAVQEEMAVRLSDAILRRTEAGSAGHPGADAIARAATIMGHVLGWDEWRKHNEIAELEAFYKLPT
jgi:glycerol-3-phosphate dehydrogenase